MSDLIELINLIEYSDKTCIILSDYSIVFSSEKRGVSPMLDYYNLYGKSDKPLIVVDKVMGKSAVILADLIGAETVVTPVISEIALEYAKLNNINTEYDITVPYIINREGNGQCPVEASVIDVNSPEAGYKIICKTLESLKAR